MRKHIDCRVFGDQLDAALEDALPDEGYAQLHLHAAECPGCAMQLAVHEHLVAPELRALEQDVPPHLVATVWPRVARAVAAGRRSGGWAPRASWMRWGVPALAAATVALVFSTGYLGLELGRLRAREARLAQQVIALEEGLAAAGGQTGEARRMAGLGARAGWVSSLARQDHITVVALRDRLRSLPEDVTLLSPSQVALLRRTSPSWAPAGWRDGLRALREGEGLRVRDLLDLLESAALSPETTLPTAELLKLLS